MVLAVAHPNPWSSASFYLPSQSHADRFSLQPTFMPPRGRPTLVVLPPRSCRLLLCPALGALGVQSLTAHPGPGSSEAHPAGRMIGIGLRAREP